MEPWKLNRLTVYNTNAVEYIFHQACNACPDFPVTGRHTKQFLVTEVILLEDVKAHQQAACNTNASLIMEKYHKVCQMTIYNTTTF